MNKTDLGTQATVLIFMLGAQWQLFNRVDDVLRSIDKTRYELHTEIIKTKGDIREYQGQVNIIKQRLEKLAKWFIQIERKSHK